MIPWAIGDRLLELTGNEVKVWLVYARHADLLLGTASVSDELLMEKTSLSHCTVQACKKGLRDKKWLAYTGESVRPRNPSRRFAVPVMQVLVAGEPYAKFWHTEAEAATYFLGNGSVTYFLGTEGYGFDFASDSKSGSKDKVNGSGAPLEKRGKPNQNQKRPQTPASGKSNPSPASKGGGAAADSRVPPPTVPAVVGVSGKPKAARDGTPFPPDFDLWGTGTKRDGAPVNYGWGNAARTYWLQVHDPDAGYDGRDLWRESRDLMDEVWRARMRNDANRHGEISRAVAAAEHVMEQLKKEGIDVREQVKKEVMAYTRCMVAARE